MLILPFILLKCSFYLILTGMLIQYKRILLRPALLLIICRKLEPIHVSAREGKTQELLSYIENGISVNMRGLSSC